MLQNVKTYDNVLLMMRDIWQLNKNTIANVKLTKIGAARSEYNYLLEDEEFILTNVYRYGESIYGDLRYSDVLNNIFKILFNSDGSSLNDYLILLFLNKINSNHYYFNDISLIQLILNNYQSMIIETNGYFDVSDKFKLINLLS